MVKKLEWSFSALSTLRKCNRMYYFQYIAPSHHFTNPLRRRAHELKKSKNFLMWRGSVIDKIMELEIIPRIKNRLAIDYNEIAELAISLAKRQFKFSEEKLFLIKENSESKVGADYCILDVHYLGLSFTEEEVIKVYDSISDIIKGIAEITMPDGESLTSFLSRASFMIPNMRSWGFQFENIEISPQLDLFMFVDNQAVVLDWKVSESSVSDYSRQLVIGGITVFDTYRRKAVEGTGKRLRFEDIRLIEVNLFKKDSKEHTFSQEIANECIDYIYLNSDDVAMLTQGNSFDHLAINDFPITDKESTCVFCKYRSLCIEVLTSKKRTDETKYDNSVQAQQPEQLEFLF